MREAIAFFFSREHCYCNGVTNRRPQQERFARSSPSLHTKAQNDRYRPQTSAMQQQQPPSSCGERASDDGSDTAVPNLPWKYRGDDPNRNHLGLYTEQDVPLIPYSAKWQNNEKIMRRIAAHMPREGTAEYYKEFEKLFGFQDPERQQHIEQYQTKAVEEKYDEVLAKMMTTRPKEVQQYEQSLKQLGDTVGYSTAKKLNHQRDTVRKAEQFRSSSSNNTTNTAADHLHREALKGHFMPARAAALRQRGFKDPSLEIYTGAAAAAGGGGRVDDDWRVSFSDLTRMVPNNSEIERSAMKEQRHQIRQRMVREKLGIKDDDLPYQNELEAYIDFNQAMDKHDEKLRAKVGDLKEFEKQDKSNITFRRQHLWRKIEE
eukprot:jgi/Bigna1/72115/fgenesh1_pg.18_\